MGRMTEKHRKALSVAAVVVLILFLLAVTVFLGKPLLAFFEDPQSFRAYVEEKGFGAGLVFTAMVVLQVIVALIPGEPLEIAAGVAFGSFEGTLLCLAGIAVGSTLVFLFVRRFGVKLVEVFFPIEKIHSLRFLQNSRKFHTLLFLIMFIPGTPKDLISYFVGLTEIRLGHWILISVVARIPSVITSTVGGNALGEENLWKAALVFGVTLLFSIAGLVIYDGIIKPKNEHKKDSKEGNNV
ncbi:MAG: TVP38/TMEM64 family protein [Clostridia bacterium]|nr:TVP38/TMEM64 family protein [Clostridia bacterium]